MDLKLEQYRKAHGMTQKELAKALKKSVGTIQSWESGASYPNAEAIWNICELFGTDPNTFLGWYERHPNDVPPAVYEDARQKRMNEAYARLSDTAKDLASGAVIGMMQNDCAREAEEVHGGVSEGAA